jgi:DNA-binding CsgD family transcriptional regulator
LSQPPPIATRFIKKSIKIKMNSDKTQNPDFRAIDRANNPQKQASPETLHHGQLLERVVRRAPIGISEIARKLKISRRTIYNWFESDKINLDVLRKIGHIIGYNFSTDLPEEFMADKIQGMDQQFNQMPFIHSTQNDTAYYWMGRYIQLLENVNQTLLSGKVVQGDSVN